MTRTDARNDEAQPAGLGALTVCPTCGGRDLTAVADEDTANFLCAGCGRCWHVELGYVHRVDPRTCGSCPRQPECLARWDQDS